MDDDSRRALPPECWTDSWCGYLPDRHRAQRHGLGSHLHLRVARYQTAKAVRQANDPTLARRYRSTERQHASVLGLPCDRHLPAAAATALAQEKGRHVSARPKGPFSEDALTDDQESQHAHAASSWLTDPQRQKPRWADTSRAVRGNLFGPYTTLARLDDAR